MDDPGLAGRPYIFAHQMLGRTVQGNSTLWSFDSDLVSAAGYVEEMQAARVGETDGNTYVTFPEVI